MKIIKKIKARLGSRSKSDRLVKVYSHPRSGTHFLEAFLASNFYANKDLSIAPITWGHWSNRKVKEEGNPYGKLFGSHYFPDLVKEQGPKIYIYRDARAVAYSIWKTSNFIHKDLVGISFSDFLRSKIDWSGSTSRRMESSLTILEHWEAHIKQWRAFANEQKILVVRYEDLLANPYNVYTRIHDAHFKRSPILTELQLDPIKAPIGLLPNKAKSDSWKEIFTEQDLAFYRQVVSAETRNEFEG